MCQQSVTTFFRQWALCKDPPTPFFFSAYMSGGTVHVEGGRMKGIISEHSCRKVMTDEPSSGLAAGGTEEEMD